MKSTPSLFSVVRTVGRQLLMAGLLLLSAGTASATSTHYVVKDNPGAESPFLSWDTAAPDIQSAIDVAPADGLVLVANGVYDSGSALSADGGTNRIVVPDTLTVQSANGPASAILQGGAGIRCAALAGSARLVGFGLTGAQGVGGVWGSGAPATVENGWIYGNAALRGGGAQGVALVNCILRENSAILQGGGAFDCFLQECELALNAAENGGGASASALWNCVVISNSASDAGGGAADSSLRGCRVVGNSASQGGGAFGSDLSSSTVHGNRATAAGGGVHGGEVFNSIVSGNALDDGTPDNWSDSTMQFSCSSPLPAGIGNTEDDPGFTDPDAGNFRLGEGSPCIDAGTNQDWMAAATDLEGTARIVNGIVDMGAYEYDPPPVPDPQLAILGINGSPIDSGAEPAAAPGTDWMARAGQDAARSFSMTNAGNAAVGFSGISFSGAGADAFSIHAFPSSVEPQANPSFLVVFHPPLAATYEATLRIVHSASNIPSPFDLNLRGTGVLPVNRHVAHGNPNATPPYTNWAGAAADIQSAIDLSMADDTIWVSNGVYADGQVAGLGEVLHRVAITNAIAVRSVNGPGTTFIQGDSGIRCVYLGANATLSGFTLTNGLDAGGIWCADQTAVASQCVVAGNSAPIGGGVLGGTLRDCVIAGNTADSGGGAFHARLFDCELFGNAAELGGGAGDSEIDRCTLWGNTATEAGGGTHASIANNSLLRGNTAAHGGGAFGGNLYNCTLVGNSASAEGGGVYGGDLLNCIVYDNDDNVAASTLSHCCVPQPLPGPGNIDADPLFLDPAAGDFRLATNSPCLDAGSHAPWMDGTLDRAGHLRVVGPAIDMGAYEHPFTPSGIEAQWLKDHDLPWDGSADFLDADEDRFSNWKEWRARTDPNDPDSLLAFASPLDPRPADGIGWILRWQSVTGLLYSLERSTNLLDSPPFLPLVDAIPGQDGFTTHTDRTATASSPSVYRILLP